MRESAVRFYGRGWPLVIERARGARLWSTDGAEYLDFFAGAGSLNYGHNPACVKRAVQDYIAADGPINTLDVRTSARDAFMLALDRLTGRLGGEFRVQFVGPGGADAVEAALRLSRIATGRRLVVSLDGAFHGMSMGARLLSDGTARGLAEDAQVLRLPHELVVGYDAFAAAAARVPWPSVAAVFIEVVQAEGGVRSLSPAAVQLLRKVTQAHGTLLVVDDVQAGCGRTGTFFSFEHAGVQPDIVCLSKSLSGGGFPLAVNLVRAALDVWRPGEFSGTFRGQNLAFVGGVAVLENYWADGAFADRVRGVGSDLFGWLGDLLVQQGLMGQVRGRGLMLGLVLGAAHAHRLAAELYAERVLVETCGPDGAVVKLLPPLTCSDADLEWFRDAMMAAIARMTPDRRNVRARVTPER